MTGPYGLFRGAVLDDLYRQQVEIMRRRVDALAAMGQANRAGDNDAWDTAAELHDALSDELAPVNRAIWELEEIAGFDEWRAERSNAPLVL